MTAAKKAGKTKIIKPLKPKVRRKRLTSLVIDRAKWGRCALRNNDGSMCCLGFACAASGVQPRNMMGLAYPCEMTPAAQARIPTWLRDAMNAVDKLAAANDAVSYSAGIIESEADRERQISGIFAKHGCKVTFVGERP